MWGLQIHNLIHIQYTYICTYTSKQNCKDAHSKHKLSNPLCLLPVVCDRGHCTGSLISGVCVQREPDSCVHPEGRWGPGARSAGRVQGHQNGEDFDSDQWALWRARGEGVAVGGVIVRVAVGGVIVRGLLWEESLWKVCCGRSHCERIAVGGVIVRGLLWEESL